MSSSIIDLDNVQRILRADIARTEVAQTKLTPSESRDLDELVIYLRDMRDCHGATRSSVVRAIVIDGLEKFREEMLAYNLERRGGA